MVLQKNPSHEKHKKQDTKDTTIFFYPLPILNTIKVPSHFKLCFYFPVIFHFSWLDITTIQCYPTNTRNQ